MTTSQIFLIVVAVLIMLAGLYFIYRGIKRRELENEQVLARDKNGIPILPRHERNVIDPLDFDDTVGGETIITPDRSHLRAVVEDDIPTDRAPTQHNQTHLQGGHHDNEGFAEPRHVTQGAPTEASDNGTDLFSSLASATANIKPAIDTADEPEFTQNSPVLDRHLLSSAEHDQNSPLNNATENVNITLVPADGEQVLSGEVLLAIVDQYGMKYGAMNMFHRYEHKDGTGILWFSMMGITQEGIAPFDLNTLPQSYYHGLVFFLSLPHPKALQGFDSMMSTAGLIAKDVGMLVLDEHNEPLTREQKQQLRLKVQAYQQNQR